MVDQLQPILESEDFLKFSRNIGYFSPQFSSLGYLVLSILITVFDVAGVHHLLSKVAPPWLREGKISHSTQYFLNTFGLSSLQLIRGL
jgi:hypothetical protein